MSKQTPLTQTSNFKNKQKHQPGRNTKSQTHGTSSHSASKTPISARRGFPTAPSGGDSPAPLQERRCLPVGASRQTEVSDSFSDCRSEQAHAPSGGGSPAPLQKCRYLPVGASRPELLAPAGSPEALRAAVAAGADAVYFGGSGFSNRMRAKNFSSDEIAEAITFCHSYGVRCFITVNTRVRDLEMPEVLLFCRSLAEMGADALILADMGIAAAVVKSILPDFPHLELHASTQMSLSSPSDGEFLRTLGFSRMVVPRELNGKTLRRVCEESPIEIEMFVHGAHCVSYSGQCLMSWAMGGRSGNRGECAQPCRMMYSVEGERANKKGSRYPLSLKDMCLASHIPEIIDSGVASLKIEGRQKSAAYVYGVTSVYRRLLDEKRNATKEEITFLDALFSRDGFTDGYFTGNFANMLGVRPENAESAENPEKYDFSLRRRSLSAEFTLKRGQPAILTLTLDGVSASASGDVPEDASAAAVTIDSAAKNLTKFGGTPFILDKNNIVFHIDDGLYYPVSGLNSIRRDCLSRLTEALADSAKKNPPLRDTSGWKKPSELPKSGEASCEVLDPSQITAAAMAYFDRIYVPCREYGSAAAKNLSRKAELCANLPAIAPDDKETARILKVLKEEGCSTVMVHSLGQLKAARELGFTADGSFRLNLTNSGALDAWYGFGITRAVISPELKLPAIRDLNSPCGVTVYGRIPLMLTERCFVSDGGCAKCGKGIPCRASLSDRMGEQFPVFSDGYCRSVIYNPRRLWMADRLTSLKNVSVMHFMFIDEAPAEIDSVIASYKNGSAPPAWLSLRDVRRL